MVYGRFVTGGVRLACVVVVLGALVAACTTDDSAGELLKVFDSADESAALEIDEFESGPCRFDYRAELSHVGDDGNVVWTQQVPWIPDRGRAPLVIVGDVALTLAYREETGSGVVAFDLDTGRPMWERTRLDANVLLASSAGVLVAGEPNIGLYDPATGAAGWNLSGPFVTFDVDQGATELLVGPQSLVPVVDFSGRMVGYDAATGDPVWEEPVSDAVSDVLLLDGTVALAEGRALQLVDQTTGDLLGRSVLPGPYPSMASAGSDVLAFSAEDRLMLIDGQTGNEIWTRTDFPGGDRVNGATASGEMIHVVFDGPGDDDVVAVAYDQSTGDVVWSLPLRLDYSTKPAMSNGLLLIGGPAATSGSGSTGITDQPGLLVALDPDTGTTVWTQDFRDPPIAVESSPAGTLVASSDPSIFCD